MSKNSFISADAGQRAERNLMAMVNNVYPGRGIIIGRDKTGKNLIQVYFLMGRSPGSRNRIFELEKEEGFLKTAPADSRKVSAQENNELIFYRAMAQKNGLFAVSNGHQTKTIMELDSSGKNLYEAMFTHRYEPDSNSTPRISAICSLRKRKILVEMSILKKSRFGDCCDRGLWSFENFAPGLGYCLTTYETNGNPLPSFEGEPFLLPLNGDIDDIINLIWEVLNEDNRVSIAVKFINIETQNVEMKIINKYQREPAV